jgi:hypothetical protein
VIFHLLALKYEEISGKPIADRPELFKSTFSFDPLPPEYYLLTNKTPTDVGKLAEAEHLQVLGEALAIHRSNESADAQSIEELTVERKKVDDEIVAGSVAGSVAAYVAHDEITGELTEEVDMDLDNHLDEEDALIGLKKVFQEDNGSFEKQIKETVDDDMSVTSEEEDDKDSDYTDEEQKSSTKKGGSVNSSLKRKRDSSEKSSDDSDSVSLHSST